MTGSALPPLGLLFDLDGTMVDSDPAHFAAFNALLEPFGRSLTHEQFKADIIGGANADIMRGLFPELDVAAHLELADRKEALFRAAADAMTPIPGLFALLERARAAGVPVGVVTNAPRANATHMLNALHLGELLETIVVAEEVGRGKPDPLPYITGCQRLGLPPDLVVAFEDSRAGVRAAVAAEIFTVGITTTLSPAALREAGASLSAASFADAGVQALISERLSS